MIKRLLTIAIYCCILVGCSTPSPNVIKTNPAAVDLSRGALVIGRSLAHQGEEWNGVKGLKLWLLNKDTNEIFETTKGEIGYSNSEYFSIWLPPGNYDLTAIFTYNAVIAPTNVPLSISVNSGEIVYAGTITHTLEPRSDIARLGKISTIGQYGEFRCFFNCKVGSHDSKGKGMAARVAIFDEGRQFLEGAGAEFINLPAYPPVITRLFH